MRTSPVRVVGTGLHRRKSPKTAVFRRLSGNRRMAGRSQIGGFLMNQARKELISFVFGLFARIWRIRECRLRHAKQMKTGPSAPGSRNPHTAAADRRQGCQHPLSSLTTLKSKGPAFARRTGEPAVPNACPRLPKRFSVSWENHGSCVGSCRR